MNVFEKIDRAGDLAETVPMCARGKIIARELIAFFRELLTTDLCIRSPRNKNDQR